MRDVRHSLGNYCSFEKQFFKNIDSQIRQLLESLLETSNIRNCDLFQIEKQRRASENPYLLLTKVRFCSPLKIANARGEKSLYALPS